MVVLVGASGATVPGWALAVGNGLPRPERSVRSAGGKQIVPPNSGSSHSMCGRISSHAWMRFEAASAQCSQGEISCITCWTASCPCGPAATIVL
jgi:hypothetical protein